VPIGHGPARGGRTRRSRGTGCSVRYSLRLAEFTSVHGDGCDFPGVMALVLCSGITLKAYGPLVLWQVENIAHPAHRPNARKFIRASRDFCSNDLGDEGELWGRS